MYSYQTDRLTLRKLDISDASFMMELMNTAEWIQFIGDKNVPTVEATEKYIINIKNNPMAKYWVVSLTESQQPMGIVTFLKRNYLEHWDIGFAFLPRFTGKGYAFEAARFVLMEMIKSEEHAAILASVLPENSDSIKLLKKLGLQFNKEILVGTETLLLYSLSLNTPS